MPSLKEYRNRIASVKSTRKITSAMKMVAASKLRRAQHQAEASQPYATKMFDMLSRLVSKINIDTTSPFLLAGTGNQDTHLLVVITSDRGLCGPYNGSVLRTASAHLRSTPAAQPMQGVCGPPISLTRPSYRPPPITVPCAPSAVVTNSKAVWL